MKLSLQLITGLIFLAASATLAEAGSYSAPLGTQTGVPDAPIPGFIGPEGAGVAPFLSDPPSGNDYNPLFRAWATGYQNYSPTSNPNSFQNPALALGPVTAADDPNPVWFDIVSLGEVYTSQIGTVDPGEITLTFDAPIFDGPGADFAVFENGFEAPAGSPLVFAELAFVEVSTDGDHWVRFPAISNTPELSSSTAPIDATDVYNLAGKHVNNVDANQILQSWGTPFDLSTLETHPDTQGVSPLVDLNNINYVKIIDIPGTGDIVDSEDNPIYDAHADDGTTNGFDLEALGVIWRHQTAADWQEQAFGGETGDPGTGLTENYEGDPWSNLEEFAFDFDAKGFDTSPLLKPVIEDISGVAHLVLRFPKHLARQAAGLKYEAQAAGTLGNWSSSYPGLIVEPDPEEPLQGEVQIWRARIPITNDPGYLRVRLVWPAP